MRGCARFYGPAFYRAFSRRSAARIPCVVATGLHAASLANGRESLATPEGSSSGNARGLVMHSGIQAVRRESAHPKRRRTASPTSGVRSSSVDPDGVLERGRLRRSVGGGTACRLRRIMREGRGRPRRRRLMAARRRRRQPGLAAAGDARDRTPREEPRRTMQAGLGTPKHPEAVREPANPRTRAIPSTTPAPRRPRSADSSRRSCPSCPASCDDSSGSPRHRDRGDRSRGRSRRSRAGPCSAAARGRR